MNELLNNGECKVEGLDVTRSTLGGSILINPKEPNNRESFFRITQDSVGNIHKRTVFSTICPNVTYNNLTISHIVQEKPKDKLRGAARGRKGPAGRLAELLEGGIKPTKEPVKKNKSVLITFCEDNFLLSEPPLSQRDELIAQLIARVDFSLRKLAAILSKNFHREIFTLTDIISFFEGSPAVFPRSKEKLLSKVNLLELFIPISRSLKVRLFNKNRLDHEKEPYFTPITSNLVVRLLRMPQTN